MLLALDGPRVIDFGISRAVTDTRLTATGAIIGTLGYMSPEQVQALDTGPASDVFSLGSVLAFAGAGSDPFRVAPGAPSASVMFRIVHGEPDLGGVPADVRGLVEACLAKDPRQRTAAPEVVGNVVCLSTSAGHFYALRAADGKRAWDVDASVPATYKRTWAVDGGNVILGTDATPPQAYDAATGTPGVRYSTQEPYVMALSVAGGVLYAIDAAA